MALYVYQGFSKEGKKVAGQLDAPSEGGVRALLQSKGVFPTSIVLAHKAAQSESFFKKFFQRSVPFKDKLLFTKQLSVLLRSGIPLLKALDLLDDQFEGQLHSILVQVKDGIKEGGSFADGLGRYPQVFENVYVQLVRAGEASGKLEIILDRLVEYLESREKMTKKIVSSLRSPLIELGIIVTIAFCLMVFMVPKLTRSFTQSGQELPLVTEILMTMADFVVNHYIVLILFVIGSVFSFLYWKSTESGAYYLDRLKLRLPLVKFFTRMGAIVQFCSTLGMLLESGVRLSQALDIVCKIVDNRILKKTLVEAKDKIVKQGKIAQYLKQTKVFPPIAIYLIETGEESGNLDTMLLEVAKNYGQELSEKSEGLAEALKPFMMLVTALLVGSVVIAVALPMANIGQAIGV
jgi:type II secretory pathway component PulF